MVTTILYSNAKLNWETGKFDTSYLCNNYYCFELIENKPIDIDNIEELDKCKFGHGNTISYQESKIIDKINELVQAVKQLNKETKNLKSLDIEICEKDINEALKKARFKKEIKQLNKEIKSIKEK